MIWLALSIVLNTAIFVLFRLLPRWNARIFPVILFNYLVCTLVGFILVVCNKKTTELFTWNTQYLWALGLGIFFIVTFFSMARSTAQNGTGLTSMFSKMSVLIPILVAVFFLNEELTGNKIAGIIVSLAGILVILYKKEKTTNLNPALLLFVFAGSGLVDTGLNLMKSRFLANTSEWTISTLTFFSALLVGLFYSLLKERNNFKLKKQEVLAGISLGIINLFSIVFLLMAVKAYQGQTGWLFVINNISIVVMSYLISLLMFKEKITLRIAVGILLVLGAMILLNN